MSRVRLLVVALGASLLSAPLLAQGRSAVSVDATVGLGVIEAARSHKDHVGVAVDALVGWRLRQGLGRTGVLALSAGAQHAVGGMNDACEVAPGGGCLPDHTRFYTLAALAGLESGVLFGAPVRVLTGLTYYHALTREGRAAGGLGLQGRVDIATPPIRRVAVVASLHVGSPFERLDGRAYRVGAGQVGLRIR